jgi:hypothetical protein
MKVRFQRKNIKIRKEINNMPNWCEGMLKIRGKQEDVFCLLINNLSVWKTVLQKEPSISIVEIPDEDGIKIDVKNKTIHVNNLAYIKGTCKNFVEPNDIEVYKGVDGNSCVALEFKGAWVINSEPYVNLSRKYNVDIKIEAFERGMEFSQFILIEKGELKEDKDIKYDNYVWDCVMPNLGG